jgi:hypothetical protein
VKEVADGTFLHFHDLETAEQLDRVRVGDAPGGRISFSTDGALLAAVCYDRLPGPGSRFKSTVAVWEVATGLLIYRLEPVRVWISAAFSADGRLLATGPWAEAPIQLWDLATGAEISRWHGHRAAVSAVAFAPDSGRLAAGQSDGTVLVWDIAPAVRQMRKSVPTPDPAALDRLWADLAGTDARKAQVAIWTLVDMPGSALKLFGHRLRPMPLMPADIPRLIVQLDSDRYADREAALKQLECLGPGAVPELQKVLDAQPSAEVRRRVGALLATPHAVRPPRSAEARRRVRSVRVLERIGSAEACRLLNELATGPAGAEETWQAKAALARLAARPGARLGR